MKLNFLILFFFIGISKICSQNDSIRSLDEIRLETVKLKRYSNGFKVKTMHRALIHNRYHSLGDLLQESTAIYLKNYNPSMLSSISFRGTNASHTSVIWNGIPVNSQLNGQTDFNIIRLDAIDEVSIRSGGGSITFGSGAIGGSIHLNNHIEYNKGTKQQLSTSLGSFDTYKLNYAVKFSNEYSHIAVSLGRMESMNDFEYWNSGKVNDNGDFSRNFLSAVLARRIDENSELKFIVDGFQSKRGMAPALLSNANELQEDANVKLLGQLNRQHTKVNSSLSLAYLHEEYSYYFNRDLPDHSFGKSDVLLGKYERDMFLNKSMNLLIGSQGSITKAVGTNLVEKSRELVAFYSLFNHKIRPNFSYNLKIRKEFGSDYTSPLLLGFDVVLQHKEQLFKFNYSKNFRIPTFNDLYWNHLGNSHLVPEKTHQGEIGYERNVSHLKFRVNSYYIRSKNFIKWLPNTFEDIENGAPGNVGDWTPKNFDDVENLGFELGISQKMNFSQMNSVLEINYNYVSARNKKSGKHLIYVPKSKLSGSYKLKKENLSLQYQFLYHDKAYTLSDNTDWVDSYSLSNVILGYVFNDWKKLKPEILLKLNNIFNKKYAVIDFRPMPMMNYTMNIKLNF